MNERWKAEFCFAQNNPVELFIALHFPLELRSQWKKSLTIYRQ